MKSIKVYSLLVLVVMIGISIWASLYANVFVVAKYVLAHPWGIATLSDTYFAFYFIYLWMFYEEQTWVGRTLWFFLVTFFGTIAIALYLLIHISKLKKGSTITDLLVKH